MINTIIERLFTHFTKVSVIAVLASTLGSVLMFLIGAVKVARAYDAYFLMDIAGGASGQSSVALSIAYLIQSIDAFLIALVLIIFGYGVFILFVADAATRERGLAAGFKIGSISELKKILADMIVIILMVKYLELVLTSPPGFDWPMLVLPASILLLAAAVRILKMEH